MAPARTALEKTAANEIAIVKTKITVISIIKSMLSNLQNNASEI